MSCVEGVKGYFSMLENEMKGHQMTEENDYRQQSEQGNKRNDGLFTENQNQAMSGFLTKKQGGQENQNQTSDLMVYVVSSYQVLQQLWSKAKVIIEQNTEISVDINGTRNVVNNIHKYCEAMVEALRILNRDIKDIKSSNMGASDRLASTLITFERVQREAEQRERVLDTRLQVQAVQLERIERKIAALSVKTTQYMPDPKASKPLMSWEQYLTDDKNQKAVLAEQEMLNKANFGYEQHLLKDAFDYFNGNPSMYDQNNKGDNY